MAIVSFHSIWQGPTESAKKISKSTAMASILAKTKVYQSNGWSCQKGRNGRWLVSFILWQKSSLFTTSNPCFSSLHIIDKARNSTRVITLQETNLTLSWVSYCPPVKDSRCETMLPLELDRTGYMSFLTKPDTTGHPNLPSGPAGPDWIRTYILRYFTI